MPTRIHRVDLHHFSVSDDGLSGAAIECRFELSRWICEIVTDDSRRKVFESSDPSIVNVEENARVAWETFAEGFYDGMRDAASLSPEELAAYVADEIG